MSTINARVLIVDDEEAVQKNIELTLCPGALHNAALQGAAAALFGEPVPEKKSESMQFSLTSVSTGKAALAEVEKALAAERPYAVIFCDMRMPGWDGLKTIEEIRRVDQRVEVVFLTAFSDHSIEEIARNVGVNISYMSKPFSRPDLRQMATRCVVDWNRARELEKFVETLSKIRGDDSDIERVLNYVAGQLCELLDSESASIAEMREGRLFFRAGTGDLARQEVFDSIQNVLPEFPYKGEPITIEGLRVVPILSFGLALTVASNTQLSPEKHHLIKVLLEHASIALTNCRLHSLLLEKEKMAEIGRTMGYVCHDIRGPLGQAELYLGLLKNPALSPWPQELVHEKIIRSLHQARELADDILLYANSKIHITPCLTNTEQIVERDIDYWHHLAEINKVEFTQNLCEVSDVFVDGPRLVRALTNIIKNAIEATAGKSIKRVSLTMSLSDTELIFSVLDTAEGIPDAVMKSLFKPFASVGKSHGTGFGLAIAQQVVQLHHGVIDVDTNASGSEFTIRIPLSH
jgi:two-component system NtrC family sensor kinase